MTCKHVAEYTDAELLKETQRIMKLLRYVNFSHDPEYQKLSDRLGELSAEQRQRNQERSVLG